MNGAKLQDSRVFVAGHRGMVGSAIVRRLQEEGARTILMRGSRELDLRRQQEVESFVSSANPQIIIVAAGRVGGILANDSYPADFAYDNLAIATNLIHAAHRAGVERLLYLGSTCIYPREAPQPICEDALLTGPLEPTNEAYALAKIAGLKLCEFYRRQHGRMFHSALPTNLYGPGDNYHPDRSHVLPAMIRRFHEATTAGKEQVVIWGSGNPRREFLHVDDLAEAVVHLLRLGSPPNRVNVGTGKDISIQELAQLVADIVGYRGRIVNDLSRPDGMMLKRTDVSRIESLGWKARIGLREGIASVYESFLRELADGRVRGR